MSRHMGVAVTALLILGGCAAAKQAVEDTKAGLVAPVAPGELSPMAQGRKDAEPLGSLPYGTILVSAVGSLLGLWHANRKGREARLGHVPVSTNPITGWLGSKVGLEGVVQGAANITHFIFERGPDGTLVKRGWKGVVSFAIPALLLLVPGVRDWLLAHATDVQDLVTRLIAYLGTGTVTVLAAEKGLSAVKPVAPAA
ncbi:MAG: hypothetical protein HYZ89_04065 [Candidatus Omnitrophica bacterium]|nr:hypothetical protein [Candidatus Omnitrophota bacterium]